MSDGSSSIPGPVLVGTGSGASTRVLVKAGILALLGNGTPFEDSVCVGPGSS